MTNVVDANCWYDYVSEDLAKTIGIGTAVFKRAEATGGFLLDAEGIIQQQYIDAQKPYAQQLFESWLERVVLMGALRLVELVGRDNLYKELSSLGLPKKEHVYFKVAVHGRGTFLVSRDIDFFDPSLKKEGGRKRAAALAKANGPICKHMKKVHGVTVCCPDAFVA